MALGILVALAAAVANAFAIVLQAQESRRAPLSEAGRASLLLRLARRPRFLAGTGLLVAAWPLQVLALALAPITVVQPILAAAQLVLLGVARRRLGERVTAVEGLAALGIVVGIVAIVLAAPRHRVSDPDAVRTAVALSLVGLAALGAFGVARRRPRRHLALIIGAGLGYAWVDFANKLLANDIATSHWPLAGLWLVLTLGIGALAFLEETTALQQRPAVTVAPVIGAIQDPLPVLMALAAGAETWGSGSNQIALLSCGLAVVTLGAMLLGRSRAVARVAHDRQAARPHAPALQPSAPAAAPSAPRSSRGSAA